MTRDEVIAALKRAAIVEIDCRGVPVHLRLMTWEERDAFVERAKAFHAGTGEPVTDAALIVPHVVTPEGERLFETVAELTAALDTEIIEQLGRALVKRAGIGEKAEATAKN